MALQTAEVTGVSQKVPCRHSHRDRSLLFLVCRCAANVHTARYVLVLVLNSSNMFYLGDCGSTGLVRCIRAPKVLPTAELSVLGHLDWRLGFCMPTRRSAYAPATQRPPRAHAPGYFL